MEKIEYFEIEKSNIFNITFKISNGSNIINIK